MRALLLTIALACGAEKKEASAPSTTPTSSGATASETTTPSAHPPSVEAADAGVAPSVRSGAVQASGLPPASVSHVSHTRGRDIQVCYELARRSNPTLSGRITVRFTINENGDVENAASGGSDLPDQTLIDCVVRAFTTLKFPKPEGGKVNVSYPIVFAPP